MEVGSLKLRVLVTGGAGFIGRRLATRLLADGNSVVVADAGYTSDLSRVDTRCDLLDQPIDTLTDANWRTLLADVDLVFHLAARKYNSPNVTPDALLATNVNATWSLASVAARVGVRRLVFASSLYAYGYMGPMAMAESDVPAPSTLYGASKLMGESILRTLGASSPLEWSVARLFFIYGPGQYAQGGYKSVIVSNFERLSRGEPPLVCGSGTQALDYVYLDDAVSALLDLAYVAASGTICNVASGHALSVNELTAAMSQVAGFAAEPIHVEPDWTEGTIRYGSPVVAKERLGWTADTPLLDGLERTWMDVKGLA